MPEKVNLHMYTGIVSSKAILKLPQRKKCEANDANHEANEKDIRNLIIDFISENHLRTCYREGVML